MIFPRGIKITNLIKTLNLSIIQEGWSQLLPNSYLYYVLTLVDKNLSHMALPFQKKFQYTLTKFLKWVTMQIITLQNVSVN